MTDKENQIQEMQILDQNLQNLTMQKQSFQIELSETQSALDEMEKSGEEVYKIIGQLMIKAEKSKIKDELYSKKKLLELKIKSFEKQEDILTEKLEKLRREIMKSVK